MASSVPPRFPLPNLREVGGRLLAMALNQLAALDPDTTRELSSLEGQRLELHLSGLEMVVAIAVVDGQLQAVPTDENPAALRVSASPGGLLATALGMSGNVSPGRVDIAGNAELARRLQELAKNYRPDFEAVFARAFGDVLGVPLAHAVREALSHVRDSASHAVADGADWVREESRLAVAPAEMDDFLDAVDQLHERTERLQARMQRLAERRNTAR